MHCRIEGGAVNELQLIFSRIWERVTGEDIWQQKYFKAYNPEKFNYLKPDTTATSGKKMIGIVNREPHTTNDAVRKMYLSSINNAKDSIRIINPYFTLIPSVNKALKNAIDRGVKVEIMVSAKSDIPLTPDCVFYNAHKLMKRGAKVWLYQPGFHHSKIMMVDGLFCTVGSTNLDARSLRFDYEENALIIDPCTTRELDHMFDNDKAKSIMLTEEEWDKFRTSWQKFRGWFASLLRPVL
jgi:cardiolipin synthase